MAQTGNHTPGPWVAHYLPQHRMRVTAYDETPLACSICDIALWNVDYGEQQANASLIAAAPDMLSELKRDLQFAREMKKLMEVLKGRGWVQYELAVQRIEALETIIAKAEGR